MLAMARPSRWTAALRFPIVAFVNPMARLSLLLLTISFPLTLPAAEDVAAVRAQAIQWRAEHRTIDMHMHIEAKEERYQRALKIMEATVTEFCPAGIDTTPDIAA